jgi:ERCC4-related helicase
VINLYTSYHSQYWAHSLTLRRIGIEVDSLSRSISSARVDLNPHQIDAALFAIRNPFSKGVILADEVGLGKTIEAGIIIAQRWAERRRRILLIVPATLRKQWQQELIEKFGLPAIILETKNFNQFQKEGDTNPFEQTNQIVICSYNFVSARSQLIKRVNWDCVVIDEAHRLRNVYKKDNRTANNIKDAIAQAPKLLLTATPLQNSLLEMYGLVSIIDEHVFGSLTSFREQFNCSDQDEARLQALRSRLEPICKRTLRRQILEYVNFTNRSSLVEEFSPTDEEHQLYEDVSAYLQRETLFALPSSQRKLMTMVLRKLLASSTFAIAGTLRRLVERLEDLQKGQRSKKITESLEEEFDTLSELADEWEEEPEEESRVADDALEEELQMLRDYADRAERISHNSKGTALLTVLEKGFAEATRLGAPHKAVIFTESRRTQDYLFQFLSNNGYASKIVLINGSNTDKSSKAIYKHWVETHQSTGQLSGSKSADMKAAIVDEFRHRATLLIATESAAEGVNLQFCSLLVNYDLPWNPQRIEQRIGRCHRYGQAHDVVVVNFLNKRNAADQRVFELLSQKFKLFEGVFGSSDEVLGALESGVDLEKRIAQVYQDCRTADDIQQAFDVLQADLDETIQSQMTQTRQKLLENVDEEVSRRLQVYKDAAIATLDEHQKWLLHLTQQELIGAEFDPDDSCRFCYREPHADEICYHLNWRIAEARGEVFFSLEHPLAEQLVKTAKERVLPSRTLIFDYSAYGAKVSALEPFLGQSGYLDLWKLTVESVQTEEQLILTGIPDNGHVLDAELCRKLLEIPAITLPQAEMFQIPEQQFETERTSQVAAYLQEVEIRNAQYFDEEESKLDQWAENLKFRLEQDIRELDKQIKEAKRLAKATGTLAEKLEAQKAVKTLESQRNQKRRELYDAQDEVEQQRDSFIAEIEQRLNVHHRLEKVYTVRWQLRSKFRPLGSHDALRQQYGQLEGGLTEDLLKLREEARY